MAGLITFRSKAATSILMFADVAERLMLLMGKSVSAQGIVTVEELPAAIAGLQAAMAADRPDHDALIAQIDEPMVQPADEKISAATSAQPASAFDRPVSLTQRAAPLLDMLVRAEASRVPVVWGA